MIEYIPVVIRPLAMVSPARKWDLATRTCGLRLVMEKKIHIRKAEVEAEEKPGEGGRQAALVGSRCVYVSAWCVDFSSVVFAL